MQKDKFKNFHTGIVPFTKSIIVVIDKWKTTQMKWAKSMCLEDKGRMQGMTDCCKET